MNLRNKKELAKKTLGVGKHRLVFSQEGLSEIKEAITKEDIKTLYKEGIISIKPVKGRKKVVRRRTRRGPGKIKQKVNKRKENYVRTTRKLRAYLKELRSKNQVDHAMYKDIRKKIKMRFFKSKMYLQEYVKKETSAATASKPKTSVKIKKRVSVKSGKPKGGKSK